ncbi:MAG: tetratricopeptide repeat protein [Firmicutes bacterium]|jgi:tetratricopeptide (TPR) repeat protein|nr:tetratricopeptide repeat protein [Bacillota bacterium]
MKTTQRLIVTILLASLLFSSAVLGSNVKIHYENEANVLRELGLFKGTDLGFELERPPTRLEALVMLVRLLGLEEEALKNDLSLPFEDVPNWGKNYVAFAYHNGLTLGYSDKEFGSTDETTEAHFLTFVLRSLGYDDSKGDFYWADAKIKAEEIALIDQAYAETVGDKFLRDHCVAISYQSLFTSLKGEAKILLEKLVDSGAVDQEKTEGLLDLGAKYAKDAAEAYKKRQVDLAIELYLKAIELKPESAELYDGLGEVYVWMIKTSREEKDKNYWLEKRQETIEKALELEPENPQYLEQYLLHLFDLGEKEEAYWQAKALYELADDKKMAGRYLARASSALGIEYLLDSRVEEGREVLTESLELAENFSLAADLHIQFYLGKANLALKNFEEAERLLKLARESNEFKHEGDRLLYLLNEETGRFVENKKYIGVPWMGLVESSLDYREMKAAIKNNV